MQLAFADFTGTDGEEIDSALLEGIRCHGLVPWTAPEIQPAELKPRKVKPIGVRVRIGPGVSEMKPPYLFRRHPVPTAAEMREMFGA